MKKNDLLLLSAVALYSYLFYQQSAGINFMIFTFFLILILVAKNGIYKNLFNLPWWSAVAGSILSSVCILFYGNTLSIIANILSLSLVAAFSVERNSSILFSGLYSLYSYLTSVVFMFIDWAEKHKKKTPEGIKKGFKFFMLIIPVLVSLVFFFLYREANPLFKNFTSNIQFDFITWSWIQFTLLGFILLYGYFYHRPIALLATKDRNAQSTLYARNFSESENTLWGFKLDLSHELSTGVILFSLLNILLLFVNILDFQYVWLSNSLPEGLNFSEVVHQGIGTLIVSIILAVLIILVYFRGNINFYSSGKTIKILAYLWILQNAFMLLSTVMRNQLYINEYSLTYKRIGVYVYLLLCLIGLFTTLIKIASAKSNWYLFRSNGWLFYGVLVLSCLFNWDRMITEFNLNNSKILDKGYLIGFSSANTDLLLASPFLNEKAEEMDAYTLNRLHNKTYNFLKFYQSKEWKSWNLEDEQVYQSIMNIQKDGNHSSLILAANNVSSLTPVKSFTNIKKLDLSTNRFRDLQELSYFLQLEELNLSGNDLESVNKMPLLKTLSTLSLRQNPIRQYYGLRNLPRLKMLDISDNKTGALNTLPVLNELTDLNISGNSRGDLSALQHFKNLHVLTMYSTSKTDLETLPSLSSLTELDISNMNLSGSDEKAICAVSELNGLKKLAVSVNNLENLYLLPHDYFEFMKKTDGLNSAKSKIPASLEHLNISYNKITTLDGIENIPSLTTLYMTHNQLSDLSKLEKCVKLEHLFLSGNKISKINALASLTNLQSLYLDNNGLREIEALKSLTQMSELDLSNNPIADLSPLAGMKNLTTLHLANIPELRDLKMVEHMANLRELNITNCPINDLSPLYRLKNLKRIYCYGIEKAKLEALQLQLPGLEIKDYQFTEEVAPAEYQ